MSCLALQSDEQGVLSAAWDGNTKACHSESPSRWLIVKATNFGPRVRAPFLLFLFRCDQQQWDLNTGQMVRMYGTSRHTEVVALGLRPLTPLLTNGAPHSDLFSTGDATVGMLPSNHFDGKGRNDDDGSGSSDNSLFGDDSGDEADDRAKATKPNGTQASLSGPNTTRNSNMLSPDLVMTAYMDGQVLLWDRRAPVHTKPLRLEMGDKTRPGCFSVSDRWIPP